MSNTTRRSTALAALLALAAPSALAQGAYPTQPIRVIVPFAAGTSDTLARLVGAEMSKELGQPIVVENRPGAGGNIGAEACARATPSGKSESGVVSTISIRALGASNRRMSAARDAENDPCRTGCGIG